MEHAISMLSETVLLLMPKVEPLCGKVAQGVVQALVVTPCTFGKGNKRESSPLLT